MLHQGQQTIFPSREHRLNDVMKKKAVSVLRLLGLVLCPWCSDVHRIVGS